MLEVISGYLFVVVGILVCLYPLYLILFSGINWYLGSVSNGEWKIKAPFLITYGELAEQFGRHVTDCYYGAYLTVLGTGMVILSIAGQNKPDSITDWGLGCIGIWYQLGVFLTYPVFIVLVLGALHTTLKKVHSLVSRIKQLTDEVGE